MNNNIALLMALPSESHGLFEQKNIPVYYTGIGKVNAAIAATDIIHKTKCNTIINLGSAGSHRFNTHELIEVKEFVQRDMDISPLGFKIGETPFDSIPFEIKNTKTYTNLPQGICGTGDSFEVGKTKVACDLVDMEAFAIAKVCLKMNIEFISIKYITDGADHNAHNDWEANLIAGAHKLLACYEDLIIRLA